MHNPASELRRIHIPRTPVNKGKKEGLRLQIPPGPNTRPEGPVRRKILGSFELDLSLRKISLGCNRKRLLRNGYRRERAGELCLSLFLI
jgi:hypothetical protein